MTLRPRAFTVVLASALLVSSIVVCLASPRAGAASWTDDFAGTAFDPRWTFHGDGLPMLDNDTHWFALYHDVANETAGVWRGPAIRAQTADAYEFDVSATMRCIAGEEPVGRAEVRLLDSAGASIYAFSWTDPANTNNAAQVSFFSGAADMLMYTTGATYDYSIFMDKSLRLARLSGQVSFYIDGALKYSGTTQAAKVSTIQLALLKDTDICPLSKEDMTFDSVSLDYTAALTPSAPTGLAAAPSNGAASLSWSSPDVGTGAPVIGYRIYRGYSSGNELFLTSVGPTPFYNDSGLTNGQPYFYKVSAVSGLGEGAISTEASAVPRTVPGQPVNLQTVGSPSRVSLTWSPPADDGGSAVIGYKVYRGTQSGSPSLLAALGAVVSYDDAAVTADSSYYYSVSAVNGAGEGAQSGEAHASTLSGTTLPSAPRDLAALSTNGTVALSWSAPLSNGNTLIDHYSVYRGASSGERAWLADVAGIPGYADAAVTAGRTYYYTVTATNAAGESPTSGEARVTVAGTTVLTEPSEPLNLTLQTGDGFVLLTWESPADDGGSPITSYKVYRGSTPSAQALLVEFGPVNGYSDTDLASGDTYCYAVSAVNAVGEGAASATANVTIASEQSVTNETETDDTSQLSHWTWKSSVVMLVLLVIGSAGILWYMRTPESPSQPGDPLKGSGEKPDESVDGESDEDAADEEGGHD
ncbi:MAG: fibronectin type III domain-containing protein [Methanobacteriota archaeon]